MKAVHSTLGFIAATIAIIGSKDWMQHVLIVYLAAHVIATFGWKG